MKHDTGKRSLEGLKVFPYVAWGLTVVFALFVYNITTDLQAVTAQLQQQTQAMEAKIQDNNTQIDFDSYNELKRAQ